MKFMNQAARNWANPRDEEGDGSDGSSGGDADGESDSDSDSSDDSSDDGSGDDSGDSDSGDASGNATDWRDEFIITKDETGADLSEKEIKKQKNILGRFTDKAQFTKSYLDLHGKVRSAKPAELPENATEEQIKEHRKAVGLPETVDDYKYEFSEGLVLGEDDTFITEGLKETALELGVSPKQMSAITEKTLKLREAQMVERTNRDNMLQESTQKALNERWGSDMTHNLNAIDNTFNALPGGDEPDGAKQLLLNARGPNGDRLFDNPDVMHLFASLARKANPESALSDGSGSGSVTGRMDELKAKMSTDEGLTSKEVLEYAELKDLAAGRMKGDNKRDSERA